MSAYWCARVHVTDAETYAKYAALAGPAIEKHGGVFLARGGKIAEVPANVTADPPKKPSPDYGGRPI